MQGAPNIKPTKARVLVERLEGHGIERVTKGGIVLPATLEAKARTKRDVFRARILAVGPDAHDVRKAFDEGFDHVLVYAWSNGSGKGLYTGLPCGQNRLLIESEDVVVAVAGDAHVEARNSTAEVR